MIVQICFTKGVYSRRMTIEAACSLGLVPNHRQIEKDEVVYDIDCEDRALAHKIMDKISARLCAEEIGHRIYDTTNRGYHIHIRFPHMKDFNQPIRTKIRTQLRLHYCEGFINFIDKQKDSDRNMIRLELSNHETTGKPKMVIYETKQSINNQLPLFIKEYLGEWKPEPKYETVKIDNEWVNKDQLLQYCLSNKIPEGRRNVVLFKNLAIGMLQAGLTQIEMSQLAKRIVANCEGKKVKEILGWVDYFKKKNSPSYNKRELNRWLDLHSLSHLRYNND